MMKIDCLSTLFVGIDVSSKTNTVCALNFGSDRLLKLTVPNNQPGADKLVSAILDVMSASKLKTVVIALESTSFYSTHIATHLSDNQRLLSYKPRVFCLNPKMTANYRKSFIGLSKTDLQDAYIIADFARAGRIKQEPWRGSQFLALQRLTRHRLHIVECITREKTYMIGNMFLKFSELALSGDYAPFSDNYGATASAILTEFLSLEEITLKPLEELVDFIYVKSRGRIKNPHLTASILQKAARDSYRLDKCLYEPLTISIASSYNCISAFQQQIKIIDKAIERAIVGVNNTEYQCLKSIPGIGHVYAAGILAEIGTIADFRSHSALAKYSGIIWIENQSGDFRADETRMSKQGNRYLRYYLIEAANSVRNHCEVYGEFYRKKYREVTKHQHKRALALTARKLIRLIFGLLANNQLFSDKVVSTK